MEKYYNDKYFREMITKLVSKYGQYKTSLSFYEDSNYIFNKYCELIFEFVSRFNDELYFEDFLDAITKTLTKSKTLPSIELILSLCKYTSEKNILCIFRYVVKTFPEEINKHKLVFKDILKSIEKSTLWLECIEILSDTKYKEIQDEIILENESNTTHLFNRYLERYKSMKSFKKENDELKERLKLLELQIKYMPYGDGYYETKEHFESLNN